jgi:hypothetical protein
MNFINVLEHSGVLGMRWGVRRNGRSSSTNKTSSEKKRNSLSDDHAKMVELRKKKISELSNAEIQFLNTRIQSQVQYKQLTKTRSDAIKSQLSKALLTVGKEIIKEAYKERGGSKAVYKYLLAASPAGKG